MSRLHRGKFQPKTNWPDWLVWNPGGNGQPAYIECNWPAMGTSDVDSYMRSTFMVPVIKPIGVLPGTMWYYYFQGSHAGYTIDVSMYTTMFDGVEKGMIEMYGALDGTNYAYDRWDVDGMQTTSDITLSAASRVVHTRRDTSIWGDCFNLQLNSVNWSGIPDAWLDGP